MDASTSPGRFTVERELGAGGMGVVYAAWDSAEERRVAMKTFHALSGDAVLRIKNEFRALADIEHPNLVRLDELHCEAGRWFFTMELVEGVSFRDHVCGEPPSSDGSGTATVSSAHASGTLDARTAPSAIPRLGVVDAAEPPSERVVPRAWNEAHLREATSMLVAALAHLHELGRVHCDVKPSNVLVTPAGRVVLLDFGLARLWRGEESATKRGRIEGTVAYMAPEQAAGERPTPATDLYAVGAMLYEILAGRLPYVGGAAQVLAEKQRAEPPRRFPPSVPKDLADLTMALLRRDPSARPSGAEALARLGEARPSTGSGMSPFSSAREVFVGRADEIGRLEAHFGRSRTEIRAVLIRGQAGVGKSALARHFAEQLRLRDGALVLASRCHEQESVPLKAIDGIVDEVGHELLALDEAGAARLLPPDLAALVRAFPTLGRVPAAARAAEIGEGLSLSPEQRDRAATALAEILRGLARTRPVVLLVDDLQWADDASWPFLAKLAATEHLPVLVLATARPAEEAGRDPVARLTGAGVSLGEAFAEIDLGGLPADDAMALLRASVTGSLDPVRARELAAESKGHPLFLQELGRLDTADRPASLASALDARIGALEARELDVLEIVCLAGSAIDVAVVSHALQLGLADGALATQMLKGRHLLRIDARGDRRVVEPYHDSVREVVEARLQGDVERRIDRHEAIGGTLLDLTPAERRGPVLFSIVNNLNRAASRRETPEARAELARLNAQAGKRAAEATAHAQALAYIDRGLSLLGDASAPSDPEVAFELLATRMEIQHVAGDYAAARATFRELAERAATPGEIGRVYSIKVMLEANADADADAVRDYREGLARLGFPVSKRATTPGVIASLLRTQWTLRGWSRADLTTLPIATSERVLAGGRIASAGGSSLYRVSNNLLLLVTCEWLRRSLVEGVTRSTPNVLAGYAMALVGARNDYARAAEIVCAAIDLAERAHGATRSIFAEMTAGLWVLPWVRPYRECQALLRRTASEHRRIGEYLWVNVCYFGVYQLSSWLGSSVEELRRDAEIARSDAEATRWRDHSIALAIDLDWANLIASPTGEDPLTAFPSPEDATLQYSQFTASFHRMMAELHFGTRERAYAASHALQNEQTLGFALVGGLIGRFVRAIAARALVDGAGWRARRRLLSEIRTARKALARAATSCPENFEARHLLLEADVSRLREGNAEIDRRFARAIEVATRHADLQPLALSHELWAEALLERGDTARAAEQVERACAAWERYGAPRIAGRVRQRLGAAFEPSSRRPTIRAGDDDAPDDRITGR